MEINIQKIINKHCFPDTFNLSVGFNSAIKEIITEVLKEAADSAKIDKKSRDNYNRWEDSYFKDEYDFSYSIQKLSITSTINKVKF